MDEKTNPLRDPKTGIIRGMMGQLYEQEKAKKLADRIRWEINRELYLQKAKELIRFTAST